MENADKTRKALENILNDPISNILLKYSNLTKIQFETLIIDLITENPDIFNITYEDKRHLRSKNISGGSFRRTLQQARKNIITSIFTILLLYYIGFFENIPFEDYLLVAEKLKKYIEFVDSFDYEPRKKILSNLENELLEGIKRLSEPKSLKNCDITLNHTG
ncbi:MAG: hypothetical protein ACUVV4_04570 [Candidatus Bathyarchaeia archaeon]